MNCIRFAALVAISSGFAFPQSPPDSSRVYQIEGRVVDADNGHAIPMATVSVSYSAPRPNGNAGGVITGGTTQPEQPETRLLVTDASGTFRLSNVPAGYVAIGCNKAGYLFSDHPKESHAGLYPGTGKETVFTTTLYLRRHAVIHGTVLDEKGNAPIGGSVQAFHLELTNGRRVPRPLGYSGIRADGTFRLMGLKPGRYYVVFTPNGSALPGKPGQPARVLRTTFFPASPDFAGARVLRIQSGEEQFVDFRLVSEPGYRITGRVTTESEHFSVSVHPVFAPVDSGYPAGSTSYDPVKKTFQVSGLPAGAYRLTARFSTGDGGSQTVGKRLDVNGDMSGIVLDQTQSSSSTPITVRFDGAPPARVPRFYWELRSESRTISTYEDRHGNLRMGESRPGIYALVPPNDGYFIKSASQGGRDVLRDGVLIPEEGAPAALEITLGHRQSTRSMIELRAETGGPQQDMIHVAVFRKTPTGLILQSQTHISPPGRQMRVYGMRELSPGEYVTMSWIGSGQIEQVAYNESGFADRYSSAIESLTINEGDARQQIVIRRLLPAAAFEER